MTTQTTWQQVKPGDTVTVSHTFIVDSTHVSEVTGRVMVTDPDFRAFCEREGFVLTIVRADPWHVNTTVNDHCGCGMGRDHDTFEYLDHYRLRRTA